MEGCREAFLSTYLWDEKRFRASWRHPVFSGQAQAPLKRIRKMKAFYEERIHKPKSCQKDQLHSRNCLESESLIKPHLDLRYVFFVLPLWEHCQLHRDKRH